MQTNNKKYLIAIVVRKEKESKDRSILHNVDIRFSSHLEAGGEEFDLVSSPEKVIKIRTQKK